MRALRNGQTLVMMSLTVLLLTLMVMMTISIGSKIKDKMEVQTLADSAAYSQAIATARTYNALSTMNRVGIAHVVGVTAIQSLVSWSTYVKGTMSTIEDHYDRWNREFQRILRMFFWGCCSWGGGTPCWSGCCNGPLCFCSAFESHTSLVTGLLGAYNAIYDVIFRALDLAAWGEALAYLTSLDFIHYVGQLPAYYFLRDFMDNQSGVNNLVNQARPGDPYNELQVDGSPDSVNKGEAIPFGIGGALLPINPIYYHHAFAANGSRLHPFLTNREGASVLLQTFIVTLFPPWLSTHLQSAQGAGYVASLPGPQHGTSMFSMLFPMPRFFSADDHVRRGTYLVSAYVADFGLCFLLRQRVQRRAVNAELWGMQALGHHEGTNFICPLPHNVGGIGRAYPWFMDYNPLLVGNSGDIWGQPKDFGVVYRDLARRPANGADQWNPFFRFNFTAGGGNYSQRGIALRDGTDISRQVGFATGVTYYHRGNNLFGYHSGVEPPNLFNPFWRAGLSRVNVDNDGLNDVNRALSGYPAALDSFNGLRSAGFQGWQ